MPFPNLKVAKWLLTPKSNNVPKVFKCSFHKHYGCWSSDIATFKAQIDVPPKVVIKCISIYFISADCWLCVFDLITPSQLGLGIAMISHRFDFYVDEHFKTRKWTLKTCLKKNLRLF
ncbi:hypothetical protein niasHT_032961 [Heterodera trifolii]|uniref:Uncharacterized protein n=1 Tax=Heterodera trifolii TaxID=157864 RepID=A0ABD2HRE3_9BILA